MSFGFLVDPLFATSLSEPFICSEMASMNHITGTLPLVLDDVSMSGRQMYNPKQRQLQKISDMITL